MRFQTFFQQHITKYSRIDFDPKEFPVFEKTWMEFFKNNKFSEMYFDKKDNFLKYFIKMLPKENQEKIICLIKNKKKECAKRFSL